MPHPHLDFTARVMFCVDAAAEDPSPPTASGGFCGHIFKVQQLKLACLASWLSFIVVRPDFCNLV